MKQEICYNIRYPARNGRQTNGSSWSVRHTAIYEQSGPTTTAEASRWIIVQPSDAFKARALRYIEASNGTGIQVKNRGNTNDPNMLHITFLQYSERDWRDYINSLERELTVLVGSYRFVFDEILVEIQFVF